MTVFMRGIVVQHLLSVSICNHFCFILLYIVYGNVTAYLEIPASDKFHSLSIAKDILSFKFSDVNTVKNKIVRKAFKRADSHSCHYNSCW